MLILGLIAVSVIVYLTYAVVRVLKNYEKHRHLPMPPQDGWLVGHLITITQHRFNQTLVEAMAKYTKSCGEVFHLRLMTHCMILVHDPEILRVILNDVDNFTKNNNVINRKFGTQRVLGDHSFLSARGGDVWYHKRQIMSRFLNQTNIKNYFSNISDATESLLLEIREKCNGRDILDLNDISGGVITSIIGSLGLDNGIELISSSAKEIAGSIHLMITEMNRAFFTPFYHKTPGIWAKHKAMVLDRIHFLRSKSRKILEIRRSQIKRGSASQDDIIAHIIKMNDAQFPGDDELIIDDIMTVFLASENTPRTIVMCLAFLARNPYQLDTIRSEIDHVLRNKKVPSLKDLDKLRYTEMVILETLRLFPAVSRGTRFCKRERTVKGYRIPDESITVYFYQMLHKNSNYWESPDEFRPLRFSSKSKRTPYSYLSFAAGPRSCLGRPLAMMQMKTILSSLLRHFDFSPLPGEEEIKIMQSFVLLKLTQGFKATVLPRQVVAAPRHEARDTPYQTRDVGDVLRDVTNLQHDKDNCLREVKKGS